ncbi:TerC family protein [Roseateles saccharophilus]|uniref:YjbE family integral membrane protein n=1 Tax=Roseateles saccharophilus TaxID=304 RepID=A0A4R3UKV1_ROSSA|nr:TerC family protein [Roseateles saccharophilus]MDG0834045.1 TerC family protein [Roseateles saccharophilus]TCU90983.1 YjbE family integral membrane protein [Roseateles saccharophilus]
MDLLNAAFLIALLKIIWVNVLLSGDNAVVIALASRNLPATQQQRAIVLGSGAAIALRVVLTLFAVQLLQLPWLKLSGAVLLLWIGIQLLADNDDGADVHAHTTLWGAVRTILIADLVMSLDNVIAVAAAANSAPEGMRLPLLVIGLGLSIPLIIFGSTLLLKLMARFPALITLGAALLGFVAGEMATTDAAVHDWLDTHLHDLDYAVSISGAIFVVAVGLALGRRAARQST